MFTRAASRISAVTMRSAFQAKNAINAYGRFSTSKSFASKISPQAYLLGLAGVTIAGYSISIKSDEYYEKTIPADLQEGQKIEV